MRHATLALLLLAACSSSPAYDGGVVSTCFQPSDGGVFVTGLHAPVPGCTVPPGPTGDLDLATLGWSRQGGVLVVPQGIDAGAPIPVVFVFHGAGGTGADARARFALEGPADGGAIFVYPNAIQGTWDIRAVSLDGRRVDLLLRLLSESYCIDTSRIYMAGFSAGAVFTLYMGCNVPGPFRGMAVVAGTDDRFDRGCCTGTLSALFIHGTQDDVILLSEGQRARDDTLARDSCGLPAVADDANCQSYACPAPYAVDWCQWGGDHDVPPWAGAEISRFFSL